MMIQVKIHTIETISEARTCDGLEPEAQPQRLNEEHPFGMVVQSGLHRDMQRLAEMTNLERDNSFYNTSVLAYNFLASQRIEEVLLIAA